MKKVLTLTALLLAAAFFFTGCANGSGDSGGGGGGSALPGHWTTTPSFYASYNEDNWNATDNKINYKAAASSLNVPEGYHRNLWLSPVTDDVYGVHVKIKQKYFTKAECGIRLFNSGDNKDNSDAYYELTFYQNSYTLWEKLSGQSATLLSGYDIYKNTLNDAINPETQENDVLFYSDGDYLVLKVNGVELKSFKSKLNTGKCAALLYVTHGASGIIDVDWNFVKFQTAK